MQSSGVIRSPGLHECMQDFLREGRLSPMGLPCSALSIPSLCSLCGSSCVQIQVHLGLQPVGDKVECGGPLILQIHPIHCRLFSWVPSPKEGNSICPYCLKLRQCRRKMPPNVEQGERPKAHPVPARGQLQRLLPYAKELTKALPFPLCPPTL